MVIKVPFVPIRSETRRPRVTSSFCILHKINNCGLFAFDELLNPPVVQVVQLSATGRGAFATTLGKKEIVTV
jgi:hypothetical protein